MQGDIINVGCFSVGFKFVSIIPSRMLLACPSRRRVGMIVHTGDFKLDYTPIDGKMTDFRRFSDLGNKGRTAHAGRFYKCRTRRTYA